MATHNKRVCDEFNLLGHTRRGFIKAGSLGLCGLSLPELLRHEAIASVQGRKVNREKSVVILWMRGGPSQHDM